MIYTNYINYETTNINSYLYNVLCNLIIDESNLSNESKESNVSNESNESNKSNKVLNKKYIEANTLFHRFHFVDLFRLPDIL